MHLHKIITTLLLLFCFNQWASAIEIKIPKVSGYTEHFKSDLLKLIISKADGEHSLSQAEAGYTSSRSRRSLNQKDSEINLIWAGTSNEYEQTLLPIRFPLYRGLLGHRVFIINQKFQTKFDKVKNLTDLQQMIGAQGIGWSDVEILEHSGLKQEQASYDNIFKMINKGRIDYFSRGVTEAFNEVDTRKSKLHNLAVEKNILLIYPFAMYFFTGRDNIEVAKVLESGFKNAYADGSFMKFFYSHPEIKKVFNQASLNDRIEIKIPNNFMTEETLNLPEYLWHTNADL